MFLSHHNALCRPSIPKIAPEHRCSANGPDSTLFSNSPLLGVTALPLGPQDLPVSASGAAHRPSFALDLV